MTEQASNPHAAVSGETPGIDADLDKLQGDSFGYFLHETNPANGVVMDKTAEEWPASFAATGLALAVCLVGGERGFSARSAAVERTLVTLRYFWNREGTTTTPFDMVVMNDHDRFHLLADVIDRVLQLGPRAAYVKQSVREKRIEQKQYIATYGEDIRDLRSWR